MSRHRNCSSGKSFAWGAIFGGLVGGLSAMLLAPKTGDKFRKDLCCKCSSVSNKACDLFEDVCDQASELAYKAKSIAGAAKKIYRKD